MAEDTNTTPETTENKEAEAKKVKVAELEFAEGFIKAAELNTDSEITEDKAKELKEKYEKWKEEQSNTSEQSGPEQQEAPQVAAEGNGDDVPPSANETGEEKKKTEEIELVPGEMKVDGENWIEQYNAILKAYGEEENNEAWTRQEKEEDGSDVEGLKGKIGEAEVHFTAPNKVASEIGGVDAVVALAKKTGQDIAFNEAWSDEFKAAVEQACEKYGVTLHREQEQAEEKTQTQENQPEEKNDALMRQSEDQREAHMTYNDGVARMKIKKAFRYADQGTIEQEIKSLKENGAVIGSPDDNSGKLAMCEYAQAVKSGDTEKQKNLEAALKKYGIESVKREPDKEEGQISVTIKPFNTYSSEEKTAINASIEKLNPRTDKETEKVNEGADKNPNQPPIARGADIER